MKLENHVVLKKRLNNFSVHQCCDTVKTSLCNNTVDAYTLICILVNQLHHSWTITCIQLIQVTTLIYCLIKCTLRSIQGATSYSSKAPV